jgi:hypothetical protein
MALPRLRLGDSFACLVVLICRWSASVMHSSPPPVFIEISDHIPPGCPDYRMVAWVSERTSLWNGDCFRSAVNALGWKTGPRVYSLLRLHWTLRPYMPSPAVKLEAGVFLPRPLQ